MSLMGCHTLLALQEKVLHDSKCFNDLLQYLTIPVSEMFRNPSYFLSLREKVIPHLKTYPSLKIWVAGCSTGEEVYSLAILLQEEELLERTILYATDINLNRLAKAEKGFFDLKEIQKSNDNYKKAGGMHSLSDYYTATSPTAEIHSSLKNNVVFADHCLVTDASFSEMNLISCRNVLIYFDSKIQDKAYGLFNDSLCRRGFLGLGASETIHFSKYEKYFDPFAGKDRIFRKK